MTHATSSTLAESEPCMCGSATLVTLVSSTCITATTMTENVSSHFRVALSSLSPAASAALLFGTVIEGRHGYAGVARTLGGSGAGSSRAATATPGRPERWGARGSGHRGPPRLSRGGPSGGGSGAL